MPIVEGNVLTETVLEALQTTGFAMDGPREAHAVPYVRNEYAGSIPLSDVLYERRAIRTFLPDLVADEDLAHVIGCANQADLQIGGEPRLLRIFVARTDGIREAGPDGMRIAGAELARAVTKATADAPAVLLICGDLITATERHGTSGIQEVLTRAGGWGYAAWLGAVSRGLGACGFGRPLAAVTQSVRKSMPNYRHLFSVTIGREMP